MRVSISSHRRTPGYDVLGTNWEIDLLIDDMITIDQVLNTVFLVKDRQLL